MTVKAGRLAARGTQMTITLMLTALAMLAFAGNSLLCRAAPPSPLR